MNFPGLGVNRKVVDNPMTFWFQISTDNCEYAHGYSQIFADNYFFAVGSFQFTDIHRCLGIDDWRSQIFADIRRYSQIDGWRSQIFADIRGYS